MPRRCQRSPRVGKQGRIRWSPRPSSTTDRALVAAHALSARGRGFMVAWQAGSCCSDSAIQRADDQRLSRKSISDEGAPSTPSFSRPRARQVRSRRGLPPAGLLGTPGGRKHQLIGGRMRISARVSSHSGAATPLVASGVARVLWIASLHGQLRVWADQERSSSAFWYRRLLMLFNSQVASSFTAVIVIE